MHESEILAWLRESDPAALADLYAEADRTRRETVGDAVHLRGLIEISNVCARECGYCGLRAPNRQLTRYKMTEREIVQCALQAARLVYGTVVLQSGESEYIGARWVAEIVHEIVERTSLAVTLSLGERSVSDLSQWREAGASRYLLRFETSDEELYARIHPPHRGVASERIKLLRILRKLDYEVGSGIMIGIPGQSYQSVVRDLQLFQELDLDMIGVGPYIPHPATPLAGGGWVRRLSSASQVPNTEEMVYKVLALSRILCPHANIPGTTALATINQQNGRELALMCGANVVMPNLTPPEYRRHYEIYPNKACISEGPEDCGNCLQARIRSIGRYPGAGSGGRQRAVAYA